MNEVRNASSNVTKNVTGVASVYPEIPTTTVTSVVTAAAPNTTTSQAPSLALTPRPSTRCLSSTSPLDSVMAFAPALLYPHFFPLLDQRRSFNQSPPYALWRPRRTGNENTRAILALSATSRTPEATYTSQSPLQHQLETLFLLPRMIWYSVPTTGQYLLRRPLLHTTSPQFSTCGSCPPSIVRLAPLDASNLRRHLHFWSAPPVPNRGRLLQLHSTSIFLLLKT